jgi:hypothetical protein
MRFRYLFLLGGGLAVMAALLATDPDRGLSTGMLLLATLTPLLAVGFAHLARKALHDYPEADARHLFAQAGRHPVGAGLALVALAIVINGLLGLFGGAARAATPPGVLPGHAAQYLPLVQAAKAQHWSDHPAPWVLGGMVEQETCISPRHPRCWHPTAQLKSAREEGAGLGQLTRTWRANGTVRFDALAELRAQHPALRALSWANVYQRPDLQAAALVLKSRGDYRALGAVRSPQARVTMQVAAYNRGLGGINAERRACQATPGCDPQQWWGHVERTCTASRVALYGGRSACDINRAHVHKVMNVRGPRYVGRLL